MNINNEKLNTASVILTKVIEVFHWVAAALLGASLLVYFLNDNLLKYFIDVGNGELSIAGYSVNVLNKFGDIVTGAFVPSLILGIVTCGMTAMIFRNIYLIFKTSEGKTKFSEGKTPFQENNIRMLREIGIFAIAIPIIEFIFDIIIKLIVGVDLIESSISTTGIVLGIAVLCLSQFFVYGMELQRDSDGLV